MKASMVFLTLLLASATGASAADASPVSKVFQMLGDLETKIIREGTEGQKAYDEFTAWCEDRSKNVQFEIRTGKADVEELSATIEKETSSATALSTQIEELGGSIAKDNADLQAATQIRAEESADFQAE